MNLLLVEDDENTRSLLKILLEMEGFSVTPLIPEGNEKILAAIENAAPDLVLMDVNLKRGNGIEVIKLLRAKPTTQALRVVMTSGSPVKEKCMEAGADGFLMKPYMPADLIAMLQSAA